MAFAPTFTEKLLSWGMNIASPDRLANFFIAFHTGDPQTTGANEAIGLTRTQHDSWALGSLDDGSVQNSGAGESSFAIEALTITHFSVWSADTDGSFLFGGPLEQTQSISVGDKLTWGDGELTATIS